MGFLGKIIDRIKENKARSETERAEDDGTDSYLRALRNMRQKQLDEMERSHLQRVTSAYERDRVRKGMYGYKEKVYRKKPPIGRPRPVLKAKSNGMLGSHGKKIGGRNKGKKASFLGRYPL